MEQATQTSISRTKVSTKHSRPSKAMATEDESDAIDAEIHLQVEWGPRSQWGHNSHHGSLTSKGMESEVESREAEERPPMERRPSSQWSHRLVLGSDATGRDVPPPPAATQAPKKEMPIPTVETPATSSFDDMGLSDSVLRGIYAYGFETPSRIQQQAIVPMIQGHDMIMQAPSGTGKTGAFAIGCLQQLVLTSRRTQALILAPSRELAVQLEKVFAALGDYLVPDTGPRISHAFVGGTSVAQDMQALRHGVPVAVGNPGRVHDLVTRGSLRMQHVKLIVLDEGDELLSRTFRDQVYDIFTSANENVQVVVAGMTIGPGTISFAERFLRDPVRILVPDAELTLDGIRQFYIDLEREDWKFDTLADLYDICTIGQAIVFVTTRRKVDWLAEKLRTTEYTASYLHGDMAMAEQQQVMAQFRSGRCRLLIATDKLARGIDVQQVGVVLNYDMPSDCEAYLHRIGRCGRYGRKGVAISLITPNDVGVLPELKSKYGANVEEMPMNVADYIA